MSAHGAGRFRTLAAAVPLVAAAVASVAQPGDTPGVGATDESSGGAGLWLVIEVERLSDLAHPALAGFEDVGPLRGRARLVVRDGRLALEELNARAEAQGATLDIEGSVADATTFDEFDLAFRLQVPSARWWAADAPGETSPGPLLLSGRASSAGDALRLDGLALKTLRSDLVGHLVLVPGDERLRVTGALEGSALDLDELLPPADERASEDGRLIPGEALPLDRLVAVEGELTVAAGLLRVGGLEFRDANTTYRGAGGESRFDARGMHAGGRYEGTLTLSPAGAATAVALRLDVDRVSWEQASLQLGFADYMDGGPTDAEVELRGRGGSLREIASTLDGQLTLHVGAGRIFNTALDDAGADLLDRVVGVFTPREDDAGVTDVECAALRLDFRGGVGHAERRFVVLTRKVVMSGTGTMDLRDESLSLVVDVKARKGWTFSAASLAGGAAITGPIRSPEVGLNPTRVATSAASAVTKMLGALATGGLSLLGQRAVALAGKETDPCTAAIESGAAGQADPEKDRGEGPVPKLLRFLDR